MWNVRWLLVHVLDEEVSVVSAVVVSEVVVSVVVFVVFVVVGCEEVVRNGVDVGEVNNVVSGGSVSGDGFNGDAGVTDGDGVTVGSAWDELKEVSRDGVLEGDGKGEVLKVRGGEEVVVVGIGEENGDVVIEEGVEDHVDELIGVTRHGHGHSHSVLFPKKGK